MFVGIKRQNIFAWTSLIFLTEVAFENIPQFFIQMISNNKSDGWQMFEVVSIILTAVIIIYEIINYSIYAIKYHCLGIIPEDDLQMSSDEKKREDDKWEQEKN
jgi:hypothetical protein